jgi:beta-lactamase class A
LQRRDLGGLLAAACFAALPGGAAARPAAKNLGADAWARIEQAARGRLGVAVLDSATGRLAGHRLDERFPMCSTFKWLAAACVLARVDAGQERLDRRIAYGREVLLPHSPVTERHVAAGMTVGALCEATVTVSDNAAGNLLLESFGGPAALTAFARTLGDTATRLDRMEPALNESRPGDPRDTTTPRGMATALRAAVLGEVLAPSSRAQLVQWLRDCKTNGERLAAELPAGWTVGSKTGTGERGSTNDVGVFWPSGGRAPIVVAVYLTDTDVPFAQRQAAIAAVARGVTRGA